MPTLKAAIADFLAQKRIAVVGVSRSGNQPANAIYRRLKQTGHDVIPVNPAATAVEGATCYADLKSIPGSVDAVVVATPPGVSAQIVRECSELGIQRVWLHRSLGQGSFSAEAVRSGRERNMTVIPGGCPMMFDGSVDFAHKCLRWVLGATGSLPREV